MVGEARQNELEFFDARGVWINVPTQRAFKRMGCPPISARWVGVNKGNENESNCRSRYVARQMKALDTSGASYFASPLEALRTILGLAMTKRAPTSPYGTRSAATYQQHGRGPCVSERKD